MRWNPPSSGSPSRGASAPRTDPAGRGRPGWTSTWPRAWRQPTWSGGCRLRTGGVQWPCTDRTPDGTERLYTDGVTWAHPDVCESYGKDLVTGADVTEVEYRSLNPDGKAVLKAAEYLPPHEEPCAEYPFRLTTGRTLYHFHTRTKTARAPELNAAAPDVWVEAGPADADAYGLSEGDLVEVATPRGALRGRLRVSDIRAGTLFVPFHYGYGDTPAGHRPGEGGGRAANETTVTDWDPVSKQPLFKSAAARLTLVERGDGTPAPAPTTTASAPAAGRDGEPPVRTGPVKEG